MTKKAMIVLVLVVGAGFWLPRDPRTEVERRLDEGKVVSKGELGGANPNFSFKSNGALSFGAFRAAAFSWLLK